MTTTAPFHESFDARVWAKAFVETVNKNPAIATDEETMIGWFANAIMRGYDDARTKYDPETIAQRAAVGLSPRV